MAVLGEALNEYDTPVSVHRCDTCGRWFTLCPADPTEERFGGDCLAEGCGSYDIDRDVDLFFEPLAEHGLIERRPMEDNQ